ncbi:hypothetical protein SAMN02745119_03359 [Trichlorobacter thiogenes]|uniref:DUF2523 domain-containing protein n=1 Tax=Trichlorobacter thiogenes TaxID=115783 RepID=A0A1T4SB10_9BACT|nr:hypothetical protein [Trichlorobacter thiogenes]SKA25031.1 hypothetical protein SAMN02745119_03359 [Trichlorobacter thiogenes]
MPAIFAALISFLGSAASKIFADKVVGWIALKVLLTGLMILVLPIVLNNFLYEVIETIMGFANQQQAGAGSLNGAMSFTGFTAWLLDCFQIPAAFSVLVSALILRVTLRMIPFVRI